MANISIKLSAEKQKEVCDEVEEKVKHYESRMTNRLERWVEAAEMFSGKTSTSKENSKISPNSAELFKAIRAQSNMIVRMLLGIKPCFELECMDIIGYDDPYKMLKAEHYITNQLDLAKFDKAMVRTITQLLLYGTVAVHEQYEPLRASFLGRKRFITSFRPVSLINCAFALDSYELDECGWVCLSDIQSKKELNKLLAHDPDGKVYSKKNIESVLNQEYSPKVNTWVAQRMAWQGYVDNEFKGGMERRHYYGPLECLNDKAEYCVEICNRESIIRMEEYDGIRPVRIATINTIDVEPLGNGMYDMFRPLLSKIDDAESALLNMITLAGANMYAKQKSLSDEDTEFAIRQFGVMSLENPNLNPISPDPNNLSAIAGYTADQIQKFRQASGATDTLQAIVPADQATATSVSLAMNESVRNLSVTAQTIAPTLVQDHIRVVLQNEQMYNTEPFVLNIGGAPITVVPADLLLDVNVRIKTVTDQDFRPARLQRIREGIQLMGMFGPNAIPGKKVNPGPAILEYLKILDIPNYQDTIQDISEEDLLNMRLAADMGMPAPEGGAVGGGPMPAPSKSTITTPVGEVLAAPGDNTETTAAVRNSSVNK